MQPEILEYIKTQRVGVLCVEMPDGSPHAATVHFAFCENPIMFLFETNREYKKAETLFNKDIVRASFVIGVTESEPKTLQLDGEARLMTEDEQKTLFEDIYLKKFPEKIQKSQDQKLISFVFIPKWWRFTDFTRPKDKRIIEH